MQITSCLIGGACHFPWKPVATKAGDAASSAEWPGSKCYIHFLYEFRQSHKNKSCHLCYRKGIENLNRSVQYMNKS